VTSPAPAAEPLLSEGRSGARAGRTPVPRRLGASLPTWGLIATRHLELRKRRGLMVTVAVMTVAPTVLILGLRLAFHLFDPAHYGPAGSPSVFEATANLTAEFGFIVAAVVGAAAATTDLNDGVFRYLVITGRSRLALYLARIPAGLAIVLPAVAVAFTMLCLVTSYESVPQPTTVGMNNNISIPANLDQAQLQTWVVQHPGQAAQAFQPGGPVSGPPHPPNIRDFATDYTSYIAVEDQQFEPPPNEMLKIGLWLSLEVGIGFLVGLGLGSFTGQRTLSTILLIALEIIVTPILARTPIPYFLDGQRLDVGVAMDQLRPAGLAPAGGGGGPGPGGLLFGGRGALGIPPMPTWAMISVIVGWIVVWSVLGAWRMMTRDA